jgi:outer membrane lipoprotein-sorting protein
MWHNFSAKEATMHILQRLVASVVLLLLMAGSAAAVNISLNHVIAALETPFRPDRSTGNPPLETVNANFFQKSTIVAKNREMRADGEVFIKTATGSTPLMFRFDYFRPTRQEIVSDGQLLWMFLPENKQAIRSDVTTTLPTAGFDPDRQRAVNFLQGLGRVSKDFTITFATGGMTDLAGNYILELQPHRPMASIRRMLVVVRREAVFAKADPARNPFRDEYNFPIMATTVYDHQGNSTSMEFSNPRVNMLLPDSLFSFTPPAYVQIIRPPDNSY